jgi:hypothetical protein
MPMPGIGNKQTCSPQTCAGIGQGCGPAPDGCGGTLQCGNCPVGYMCINGGCTPGSWGGVPACQPKTCVDMGVQCGNTQDGCGHVIFCGNCAQGQACIVGNCGSPIVNIPIGLPPVPPLPTPPIASPLPAPPAPKGVLQPPVLHAPQITPDQRYNLAPTATTAGPATSSMGTTLAVVGVGAAVVLGAWLLFK